MARAVSKYTDEQKDALAVAVLERGLSAKAAAELAEAGELKVPAFQVPVSTVQRLVGEANRAPWGSRQLRRMRRYAERVLGLVEADLAKAEREDDVLTPKAAHSMVRTLSQVSDVVLKLDRYDRAGNTARPSAATPAPPGTDEEQEKATIARMMQNMKDQAWERAKSGGPSNGSAGNGGPSRPAGSGT